MKFTIEQVLTYAGRVLKRMEDEGFFSYQPPENTEPGRCFECDTDGEVHQHHVVPRSIGGTKTIPLCLTCHGKVHDRKTMGASHLIKLGLTKARAEGKKIGRPFGITLGRDELLAKHEDVMILLNSGVSVRGVSAITGKGTSTVQRVANALKPEAAFQ